MKLKLGVMVALMVGSISVMAGSKVSNQNNGASLDDFFNDDMFKQMAQIQQSMNNLMKDQLQRLQNNQTASKQSAITKNNVFDNVRVKETENALVYKVHLPQGAQNKVDVSVHSGQLVIASDVTQKVTREDEHMKSVSYSQSRQSRSFSLPKGYDAKSLSTQLDGDELVVTIKKIVQ